jgi:hypothetical protein
LFYANNTDNLRLGIQQRITNSHVPLTASLPQLDELSDVARHIAANIRNDRDFEIMVREVLFGQKEEYDGIKSKKWHAARFSSQLERLMMEYDPQFKLKTAVKASQRTGESTARADSRPGCWPGYVVFHDWRPRDVVEMAPWQKGD